MVKKWSKKILRGVLSGVAASLVVWAFLNLGFFKDFFFRFEAVTYDWRLRKIIEPTLKPEFQKPYTTQDIIIITVDGRSLNKMGSFYQWSRNEWAKTIRTLQEGNVRTVGMDFIFDKSIRFKQEDVSFVEAVKASGNLLNAVVFTDADEDNFLYPMSSEPEGLDYDRFRINLPNRLTYNLPVYERLEPDFPELMNAGAGLGAVNLDSDSDGILRRIPLFIRFNENVYPSFAMAMAIKILKVTKFGFDPDRKEVILEDDDGIISQIPVDEKGRALVYYQGPFQTFRYISLYSLLYEIYETRQETNALEIFRDKDVIIGATAPGLFDLRSTPRQPSFPGVEVHANVLLQILNNQFIRELSGLKKFLWLLLTGIISGFLFSLFRPFGGVVATAIMVIFVASAAWISFASQNLWLPMVGPCLTVLLTFTINYTYRYTVEERDKREIRGLFSRYVSAQVVAEILKHPEAVKLGGEKKVCTVLFSDLQGFAGLSERTDPQQLVKLLNEYLTEMTHVVLENHGTLDKYQADAIMALFGAPVAVKDHALFACKTALVMQQELTKIRENWQKRNLPQLHQRIGLNSGQMVVGNMGSEMRFDYTAIGDAVNLGSRLEGANKLYGTGILISEDTYLLAQEHVVARQVDLLRVKGRVEPVKVFELMALKMERLDVKILEALKYFKQGYQHYLEQSWDLAMGHFQQVIKIKGEDHPSRLYLLRCQQFLDHPPAKDWDGVYHLTTK